MPGKKKKEQDVSVGRGGYMWDGRPRTGPARGGYLWSQSEDELKKDRKRRDKAVGGKKN